MKKVVLLVLILSATTIIGCATQPSPEAYDPPGFWLGLFHGIVFVFAFVGSIFMDIRMYAFPNSGLFYDFGYVIGIITFLTIAGFR
mgnify:CR=1 FL=1|tara:strand:+ start:383 stop:640 length:258 start_codon:yes stop_codon:yes gene_type:complete